MAKIKIIRSGGQSGVDRAAVDAARTCKITICGWCPKGGWAEDYPDPPGILALYPELKETPSARVKQRTVWNVRDADATLIIDPTQPGASPGTALTAKAAKAFGKPYLVVRSENGVQEVIDWLAGLDDELILNIAGPRESECRGAYEMAVRLLTNFFAYLNAITMEAYDKEMMKNNENADEVMRDQYVFLGSNAKDSAKYYDIVMSHGFSGDKTYLAWDAAHKFGSRVVGPDFVSYCHGLIYGDKAKAAAEHFDQEWRKAFAERPERNRRKAMRMVSKELKDATEKSYGVSIVVMDGYYY